MKIRIVRRWQEQMLREFVEESDQDELVGFSMGIRTAAFVLGLRVDKDASKPRLRRMLGRW